MLGLKRVHHIAIIATNYAQSKAFTAIFWALRCRVSFIVKSATRGRAIWH